MRRLCFGGSFNPIHHGHLICARAVAEMKGFEVVVLVPSAQPPHKVSGAADMAGARDRLEMCRRAIDDEHESRSVRFEVDDLELRRGGASYTIDTAAELRARGWDRVDWLIGADMLLYLPNWHRPDALLREVNFWVMARPGWELDWGTLPPEYRHLKTNVVPAPLIEISATEIRNRVRQRLSIDYLTTAGVVRYIGQRGLYR